MHQSDSDTAQQVVRSAFPPPEDTLLLKTVLCMETPCPGIQYPQFTLRFASSWTVSRDMRYRQFFSVSRAAAISCETSDLSPTLWTPCMTLSTFNLRATARRTFGDGPFFGGFIGVCTRVSAMKTALASALPWSLAPVHLLDLVMQFDSSLLVLCAASLRTSVISSTWWPCHNCMTAAMDNRCMTRVGTGCAMGGALGASIGLCGATLCISRSILYNARNTACMHAGAAYGTFEAFRYKVR